jgi:hypothetical protein
MHKNIINKKTNNLATVQSSLKVLKLIKKIEKKWKKKFYALFVQEVILKV